MSSAKQMMDFKSIKSVDANVSNEHQRNWDEKHFERKAKDPNHNYDRFRTALSFQVGRGGVITAVDKSRRIGDKVEKIIKKHLRPDACVTAISNRPSWSYSEVIVNGCARWLSTVRDSTSMRNPTGILSGNPK